MTTRDPDSTRRAWADRPLASGALRLIVFAAPIVASLVFIMVATRAVPRPDGIVATLGWFAVLTVGAVMIVYAGDRISRRFLPVIALFRLSLVFPDHAPSRFKLAMRRNTVRQLQRAVAEGTLDEQTPQEAAEHLLLLATQLNNHDRLTRGHTERVRAYSLMIGEELGLSEDELQKLHWAGLIHDVGKLEIPAEILSKTDRPTDEEWAILRSHPSMGGHLVASGGDIVVSEDAAPQTLSWATAISAGSTDENAQDLRFVLSGADPTLFADGPTLSPSGTLRFTPAADGGIDTSTSVTLRLKIGDLNDPPDAYDDAAWVLEDSPPVVIDVLANDRDIDGDPISVQSFDATALAYGSLVDLGGGDFRFTPDPGASGSTSFTYRIADGNGGMSTANVGIILLPVNDAPTAADDAYDGPKNTDVFIAAPGLLGNDTDVDGDPLTVKTTPVAGPSSGSVTLNGNGSFRYTPNPDFVGSDSFTYRLADPDGLSSTATVSIEIYSVITTVPYYFGASGSSPAEYNLMTSPPATSDPEADVDSDGKPGLTLDKTGEGLGESDPDKYQHWNLNAGASGLLLDGPIALDLYSTSHDFHDHDGHVFVWLHDCVGLSCTQLAAIDLFDADWNDGVEDWIHRRIDLGSITHEVEPGHALRLRVQFDEQKMWVAMSGAHPSGLELTLSGPA